MLYYDRIGVSEGIDVNKTNESKECNICHYLSQHHYVASRLLTLVHSEVTKHSSYTLYFTN